MGRGADAFSTFRGMDTSLVSERGNAEGRDRLGKALQLQLADRFGLDQVFELAQGFSMS